MYTNDVIQDKNTVISHNIFNYYESYHGHTVVAVPDADNKNIVNISDLNELIKFTRNSNIKKILFIDSLNKNVELSFASNLNIKAIENNIFQSNWQSIEDGLTNNITK